MEAGLIYKRMMERDLGMQHIKAVCPTCRQMGACRDRLRFKMFPDGIFHKSRIVHHTLKTEDIYE